MSDVAEKPEIFDESGRRVLMIEPYDGHGPEDPPGWYWRYADEDPKKVHFTSARGCAVRFGSARQWEERRAAVEKTSPGADS